MFLIHVYLKHLFSGGFYRAPMAVRAGARCRPRARSTPPRGRAETEAGATRLAAAWNGGGTSDAKLRFSDNGFFDPLRDLYDTDLELAAAFGCFASDLETVFPGFTLLLGRSSPW